eukprot:12952-Eustigmatos_ZCMA.PRE.1
MAFILPFAAISQSTTAFYTCMTREVCTCMHRKARDIASRPGHAHAGTVCSGGDVMLQSCMEGE